MRIRAILKLIKEVSEIQPVLHLLENSSIICAPRVIENPAAYCMSKGNKFGIA